MNESFIFYTSWAKAIKNLPDAERLKVYDAIMALAGDGVREELDGAAEMAMVFIEPQIMANLRKRENGKRGGRPKADEKQTETKTKPNRNQTETNTKANESKHKPNVNVNVNENVNVNVKDRRMTRPTPQQVREYCDAKGYTVDADAFCDFYESKGWTVGKQPMKDWQAAVRNWSRRGARDKPNRFSTSTDRHGYDFAELEKELTGNAINNAV